MAHAQRIAVIGAGLGGLMLARALQQRGMRVVVYERDADAAERVEQGGTLDMHDDSGLIALERVGLMDAFKAVARYEGDATRVFDSDGTLLLDEVESDGGRDPAKPSRPEVDRSDLRRILLDSLDEGVVAWGHTLRTIDIPDRDDQPFVLHFDGDASAEADLLVGADGAWSRIRGLVSDVKPHYSGFTYIELMLRDIATSRPDLADLVGPGSLFASCQGRFLVSQRNAGSRIRTYAGMRAPLKWEDAPKTADEVAALFEGWAPKLRDLITSATQAPIIRPLFQLPNGFAWKHRPRITLLGDAAHLGLPNGDGANWALLDAIELADAIAGGKSIAAYERKICSRAGDSARQGDVIMEVLLGPAQGLADLLSSFGPPPLLQPTKLWRWIRTMSWFFARVYIWPPRS